MASYRCHIGVAIGFTVYFNTIIHDKKALGVIGLYSSRTAPWQALKHLSLRLRVLRVLRWSARRRRALSHPGAAGGDDLDSLQQEGLRGSLRDAGNLALSLFDPDRLRACSHSSSSPQTSSRTWRCATLKRSWASAPRRSSSRPAFTALPSRRQGSAAAASRIGRTRAGGRRRSQAGARHAKAMTRSSSCPIGQCSID